jgi:hypothetical protein
MSSTLGRMPVVSAAGTRRVNNNDKGRIFRRAETGRSASNSVPDAQPTYDVPEIGPARGQMSLAVQPRKGQAFVDEILSFPWYSASRDISALL